VDQDAQEQTVTIPTSEGVVTLTLDGVDIPSLPRFFFLQLGRDFRDVLPASDTALTLRTITVSNPPVVLKGVRVYLTVIEDSAGNLIVKEFYAVKDGAGIYYASCGPLLNRTGAPGAKRQPAVFFQASANPLNTVKYIAGGTSSTSTSSNAVAAVVEGGRCFCIKADNTFDVSGVDNACAGASGTARVAINAQYSWRRSDDEFEESEAPSRCGLQVRARINDKTAVHTESQPGHGDLFAVNGAAQLSFKVKLARGREHCLTFEQRDMPSCDIYKSSDASDSSAWEELPFGADRCPRPAKKRAVQSTSSSGESVSAESIRESPRFVCTQRDVAEVRIIDGSSS
jgi:hypothetical protein